MVNACHLELCLAERAALAVAPGAARPGSGSLTDSRIGVFTGGPSPPPVTRPTTIPVEVEFARREGATVPP